MHTAHIHWSIGSGEIYLRIYYLVLPSSMADKDRKKRWKYPTKEIDLSLSLPSDVCTTRNEEMKRKNKTACHTEEELTNSE